MKEFFQSTKGKLLILLAAILIFAACLGGGNAANQGNAGGDPVNPAPADNQPSENQPAPPEPEPTPTFTPEPPPADDPQEEEPAEEPPAPSVPDEPLKTSRLLPSLKDIMLRPEDLKEEYIMQNDIEVDNTRVIKFFTWADGREYNGITDRITGWNTYMERAQNVYAPFSFRTKVEVFETIDGAKIAFSPEWLFIYNDPNLIEDIEILSTSCPYGNECVLAYVEENIAGTTDFNVYYHLVFRYRNVTVYVLSRGLEGVVDENTVYEIADLMISRLQMYE